MDSILFVSITPAVIATSAKVIAEMGLNIPIESKASAAEIAQTYPHIGVFISRAGEQGRGFSVVANEVRKLAEESHRSAGNINSMLIDFGKSVDHVVNNVEQSNRITQELAKATQEIASMLEGLRVVGQSLVAMAQEEGDIWKK